MSLEIDKNPNARNWGYIYSYSGRCIGPDDQYDSPSIQDIAVSLGRICRYAGSCVRFFPVLLHSFVVADLVSDHTNKLYALLHDATECLVGDIPRGFKTDEISVVEDIMLKKILKSLSIASPLASQWEVVKRADNQALIGEIWSVGNVGLRAYYQGRDMAAEEIVLKYVQQYPPQECIQPDGLAVIEFVRRFREYSTGATAKSSVVSEAGGASIA
ncbi:MAG: phosphohydrolase [Candidatus Sulfotelmatobacter sp.]|nr:phosphohydrolase [Candidatus Sulfotelmatobacter sp.]